jgi:hypothetical protein
MNNPIVLSPKLIEPGVKYFLSSTLKECRKFKDHYSTILFNVSMIGLFILVIGGFLMYKYKGKLTPAEVALKNRKKQEYIFTKLQQMAYIRKNQNDTMLTDLPTW